MTFYKKRCEKVMFVFISVLRCFQYLTWYHYMRADFLFAGLISIEIGDE